MKQNIFIMTSVKSFKNLREYLKLFKYCNSEKKHGTENFMSIDFFKSTFMCIGTRHFYYSSVFENVRHIITGAFAKLSKFL